MTDLHELKGNEEQCKALAEAVRLSRFLIGSFQGLGGIHVDNFLSEKEEILVYWQQQLKSKGLD